MNYMDNPTPEQEISKGELYDVRIRAQMDKIEKEFAKVVFKGFTDFRSKVLVYLQSKLEVTKSVKELQTTLPKDDLLFDNSALEPTLQIGVNFQKALINEEHGNTLSNMKAFVSINFNLPPDINAFNRNLRERQAYLQDVVSEFTLDTLNDILADGIKRGLSFKEIAENMDKSGIFSEKRAMKIARTETNSAMNEGVRQWIQSIGVVQYRISIAANACDLCREAAKRTYDISQKDILPIHPNDRCVIISVIPQEWLKKSYEEDILAKSAREKTPQELLLDALKGPRGDDGYTPVKGMDYFTDNEKAEIIDKVMQSITMPKDGYTPQKDVDYRDGIDGKDGEDGKTPIKGVDYYTDDEKTELVEAVKSLLELPRERTIKDLIDELEELPDDEKIDVKNIKNFKKEVEKIMSQIQILISRDSGGVTSVNGQTGVVTLTTTDIAEGTNEYFTAAKVRSTVLTGLSLATGTAITAADTVVAALGKLQKQITDLAATIINTQFTRVTGRYYRSEKIVNGALAGSAIAANVLYFEPWLDRRDITGDRLGIRVTAGVALANIRIGIWAGTPGTLGNVYFDTQTVLSGATTNSDAEYTISSPFVTLAAGTQYWLGIVSDQAISVNFNTTHSTTSDSGDTSLVTSTVNRLQANWTFSSSGALPNGSALTVTASNNSSPAIKLRSI